MNSPATPANEVARLAALLAEGVLDTPPEESFDGLVRTAARLLEAPIALVSFVAAERQWFKARYGLEVQEAPRAVSFCGHVVADDAMVVVEDALADPRFADNPLVLGAPRVRFYAGAPLRSPEGLVLGTLCVIDHRARTFTPHQREVLELLAQHTVAMLELRRKGLAVERAQRSSATQLQFFDLGLDLQCTIGAGSEHFEALNPAWQATLGYSLDELRAHPVRWFIHPEDWPRSQALGEALAADGAGTVRNLENRYRHKLGHWVPLSWSFTLREGVFYGTGRDLSAYRQREEKLAVSQALLEDSEARLRSTFAAMAEGVVMQDASGRVHTTNPSAEEILGLTRDQLMGLAPVDPRWVATRPDGAPFPVEERPAMVSLATGQPLRDVRMRLTKPSGAGAWISINSQPMTRAPGERPWAVISTYRDVTEQVDVQDAILHERSFLDAVLANIPGSLVGVFDAELKLERYFGSQAALAGVMPSHFSPALFAGTDRAAYTAAARACLEGASPRVDLTLSGRRYQVSFVPLRERRGLMLAHDLTEHDALREQLYRQERLVTVGTLTSGIGHEINNPLAYVLANLEFALEEVRALATARPGARFNELLEVLESSQQGAERIRKIVRGLRALAREEATPGPVNLGEVIDVSANMAQHELKLRAGLRLELSAVPMVFAEEPRLTQVFVNLLVNAAQCFPTADPLKNTISVRTGESEAGVFAEVTDNGPGIPPEVLPRIFDPFFTTKPVGQGTGLGLPICQAALASFGGELTCSTRVGVGTTFRVLLRPASEAPPRPLPAPLKGRVLVVDDERDILAVMGRILRSEYEVVVESDSEKALARLLGPEGDFDVIFCDVIMPKLNGMQLHRAATAQRPHLAERFVMMSGGEPLGEVRDFLQGLKTARLEKPFEAQLVREAAQKVLGGARAAPTTKAQGALAASTSTARPSAKGV